MPLRHGTYSSYCNRDGVGCRCVKCRKAANRYAKRAWRRAKQAILKNERLTRQEVEQARRVRISLAAMRKGDKSRAAEIREVFIEEIHPKFLEGRRTMSAGATSGD